MVTTRRYHKDVLREINGAMIVLVESGLADHQNTAYISRTGRTTYIVRYSNLVPFSSMMKHRRYEDVYWEQRESRSYNFLMLDGALVQMVYEFTAGQLIRHRLAFLPSPNLLEYQNHPELYSEEVVYADVVNKGVVTVPFRFDFDARDGVPVALEHPMSHLTLGQYSGCRIPVSAGVTPHAFIKFVLHSFYHNALISVGIDLPPPVLRFDKCLEDPERRVVHIGIPTYL